MLRAQGPIRIALPVAVVLANAGFPAPVDILAPKERGIKAAVAGPLLKMVVVQNMSSLRLLLLQPLANSNYSTRNKYLLYAE